MEWRKKKVEVHPNICDTLVNTKSVLTFQAFITDISTRSFVLSTHKRFLWDSFLYFHKKKFRIFLFRLCCRICNPSHFDFTVSILTLHHASFANHSRFSSFEFLPFRIYVIKPHVYMTWCTGCVCLYVYIQWNHLQSSFFVLFAENLFHFLFWYYNIYHSSVNLNPKKQTHIWRTQCIVCVRIYTIILPIFVKCMYLLLLLSVIILALKCVLYEISWSEKILQTYCMYEMYANGSGRQWNERTNKQTYLASELGWFSKFCQFL